MPKDLQELRACCVEWMTCLSPTASPAASDDEGEDVILDGATEEEAEVEKQVDVMDCIEGVLELATQAGERGDDTFLSCDI